MRSWFLSVILLPSSEPSVRRECAGDVSSAAVLGFRRQPQEEQTGTRYQHIEVQPPDMQQTVGWDRPASRAARPNWHLQASAVESRGISFKVVSLSKVESWGFSCCWLLFCFLFVVFCLLFLLLVSLLPSALFSLSLSVM